MKNVKKKVVTIPTSLKNVLKQYLVITKPMNKLRPKEIDVMSLLLYYNILEKPNFVRDDDRWKKIFDYDTKLKIKEELEIEDYTLQNILSSLRKKGAIKDNKIQDYYIPDIDTKTENFMLIFNFKPTFDEG